MNPPAYPAFLEQSWIRKALAVTGKPDVEAALEALRPAVRELSDLFTTERPDRGFHDYAADPRLLTAYGLFFFPQSHAKCSSALDSLASLDRLRVSPGEGPVRILDLGSASGPCGFAAALQLAERTGRRVLLTALDHSPAALGELARMAGELPELAQKLDAVTRPGDLRRAAETLRDLPPQDLIIVGFALNEIATGMDDKERLAWVASLRPLLAPQGTLLILEPALRETAEALRRIRDALLDGPVLYPVGPDVANAPCPFLASRSPFWDHEAREWTAPDSLEFLNRKLHRDLRALKFAPLALSPAPIMPIEVKNIFRLVTPPDLQKGGIVFTAVGVSGGFIRFQASIRGLAKAEAKRLSELLKRGDYIISDPEHPGEKVRFIMIQALSVIKTL